MTVQKETKSHPDVLNYPFIYPVLNYNNLPLYDMYIEKMKIKRLKNIDLLSETFY